jgi:hypothetical protein
MDFSKIEKANEPKWHLLDGTVVEEDDIGEAFAVLIRPATPGDLRRMNRKAKKSVMTGRRRQAVDDSDVLTKELLHHCVVDWRNLTHTNGSGEKERMECNRTNREKVDEAWSQFSQMWQSAATGEYDEQEELGN